MPAVPPAFNTMRPGDALRSLRQRSATIPSLSIDSVAGRYIVLCFFGSLADPDGRGAVEAVRNHRNLFDGDNACLFFVGIDPLDEDHQQLTDHPPGLHVLWDFDARVSRACGVVPNNAPVGLAQFKRSWIVVDPTLHVLATFPFYNNGNDHERVFQYVRGLPDARNYAGFEIPAPVLVLPNVFEPALCRSLVDLHEADGGSESGYMQNGGVVLDGSHKRRKDVTIAQEPLRQILRDRIVRCVLPEISRLFFTEITRMERYIIGCYAANDGGHFRPHRDNSQEITAHRRFALSINLNADFEGGEIRFPEYNMRGIKAPVGWTVVFPCAILHAVSKVTSGQRYAFLPFLYDEDGAALRENFNRARAARETAR